MNGTELSDPALADRVPLLVQVENNPTARPPSGLNFADLIIESPVEGNTTRFSAIFMCRDEVGVDIGTVRSARYYNLDYWQQMGVLTTHFGGAGLVLARFNANGMPYLNGLSHNWGFFYRAGPWGAPHNVYLDIDGLRAEVSPGGSLEGPADAAGEVRAPFEYAADPSLPDGRAVNGVTIQTASFWSFGWEWDADSGTWLRIDAGAPNSDRTTGDRLSARTVITQEVEETVLYGENDPGGYPRRDLHLVGEGNGTLYLGGRAYDVHWSRPASGEVTTWTYADSGEPVLLPPGRIWWEVIPVGSPVTER